MLSNLIVVHSQEFKVDSGYGLNETLVAGGQLELAEEAGADAAGGGTAQTDLKVNKIRFKQISGLRQRGISNA